MVYVVREQDNKMTDLYKLDERYEREIKNLDKAAFHSENDRGLFIQFLRSMEARGIGYVQLTKYTLAMRTFLKCYHKPLSELCRQDLENFLLTMRHLKPTTRQARWYGIKKFFDYIDKGSMFFKVRFKSSYTLPSDAILSEPEMDSLVEGATTLRNKALLSVLCEGGYRIGEILTARTKDVVFYDYGVKIMISGKTGMRIPLLVKSAMLLREYIEGLGSEPKALRLFPVSYCCAAKILESTARRAGIKKKLHLHLLRHSAATHDANHLTEPQMCKKYGWSQGSKMCRTYVHLSGRDLDTAILKMNGIELGVETELRKRMGVG